MTKYFKFRNAYICMYKIDGRGGYILKGMGLSLYVTRPDIYDNLDSDISYKCIEAKRNAYMLLKNH